MHLTSTLNVNMVVCTPTCLGIMSCMEIAMGPHMTGGDVAPTGAEALGEGTHQDVHVCWVHLPIFHNAPA